MMIVLLEDKNRNHPKTQEAIRGATVEHRRLCGLGPSLRDQVITEGEVAKTILQQLGGAHRLSVMIGVKRFIDEGFALSFKFPNNRAGAPNHVTITLEANDTYTMRFQRARALNFKLVAELKNIHNSELKKTFEAETGLRLSL